MMLVRQPTLSTALAVVGLLGAGCGARGDGASGTADARAGQPSLTGCAVAVTLELARKGFDALEPADIAIGSKTVHWAPGSHAVFEALSPGRYPILVSGRYIADGPVVDTSACDRREVRVKVLPPPGPNTARVVLPGEPMPQDPVLEIDLSGNATVAVRWTAGEDVFAFHEIPRSVEALRADVAAEWKAHRGHADPSDPKRDKAIVLVAADASDAYPFLDAVLGVVRDFADDKGMLHEEPAFDLKIELPFAKVAPLSHEALLANDPVASSKDRGASDPKGAAKQIEALLARCSPTLCARGDRRELYFHLGEARASAGLTDEAVEAFLEGRALGPDERLEPGVSSAAAKSAYDSAKSAALPGAVIDALRVSGRTNPKDMQAMLENVLPDARLCFRKARPSKKRATQVPVGFVIGVDGSLSSLSSRANADDAETGSCVLEALRAERVSPPEKGISKIGAVLYLAETEADAKAALPLRSH